MQVQKMTAPTSSGVRPAPVQCARRRVEGKVLEAALGVAAALDAGSRSELAACVSHVSDSGRALCDGPPTSRAILVLPPATSGRADDNPTAVTLGRRSIRSIPARSVSAKRRPAALRSAASSEPNPALARDARRGRRMLETVSTLAGS